MLFLAKGAPYIKGNKLSVWINGKVIELTQNQSVLWKFFYGEVKTYGQLIKYMGNLCTNNTPMKKDLMSQTMIQLKSLGLIAYTKGNTDFERFMVLFKNKIVPIKEDGIRENFERLVYEKIAKNDTMSIADVISEIDGMEYTELTDGYTEDYLKFVFDAPHAHSVEMSVLNMLKNGNVCAC